MALFVLFSLWEKGYKRPLVLIDKSGYNVRRQRVSSLILALTSVLDRQHRKVSYVPRTSSWKLNSATALDDSACLNKNGTCQESDVTCSGVYQAGLCAGHATRKCCLHIKTTIGDEPCTRAGGVCLDDDVSYCSGSYISHACSGGARHRCCVSKHILVDTGDCSDFNVTIVSRDTWGARRPTRVQHNHLPVPWVFIHHTAGHPCHSLDTCAKAMLGIQKYHMDSRKYWDIAYSFLVGEDGLVYEGRGWEHRGGHTRGYNTKSIAVCVMGNFMEHLPDKKALDVIHRLLACAAAKSKIAPDYRLYGHRDVGTTACPGTQLYNKIITWNHYSTEKPQ